MKHPSRNSRDFQPARLVLGLAVFALLGLTAWNVTRTDAFSEAIAADERSDLPRALLASLDTLNRRPWDRKATLLTANLFTKLDYPDAAEPYYQRLGLESLSLGDLHVRAFGIVRANHRLRAIQAYERILQRNPADILALRRLAGVQMTQADDNAVLKTADRLIAIPEGAVFGYTLRGLVHHNQKNREDSTAAFGKVIELDPELKIMPLPLRLFWGHFAQDLLDLGRLADVRKYLTEPAEKAADPSLMNALGRAYYLEGDLDQAERCYREAAEWGPDDPVSRLNLGRILIHRRDPEHAIPYLEEAVKLAPNHYDSLYALAATYRQLGRTEDADRLQPRIDRIRELTPATSSTTAVKKPLPRYSL